MASMGVDPATLGGCQIFVTLRKGKEFPPKTFDIRVKYTERIDDIKTKVQVKSGVPKDKQQLFWHGKEMTKGHFGDKTLEEMQIHTGFGITGYDLTAEPDYWPAVEATPDGLVVKTAPPPKAVTRADMGFKDGLDMEEAISKYRGAGAYYWSELIATPESEPKALAA